MEPLASSFCGKRLVKENLWDKQVTLLTTKHLTSQIPNFITVYIDNEVWSREQKLENNAPPSVILKTIMVKRVLLCKIFEEFTQEIVDSNRMQLRAIVDKNSDYCKFCRTGGEFIMVGNHVSQFLNNRVIKILDNNKIELCVVWS